MKRIQLTNLSLLLALILIPNSIVWFNDVKNNNSKGVITNYKLVSATGQIHDNAHGSQFDAAARLSLVMSGLVDALIDKVNFLAEIVIESSMEEECEASCKMANKISLTETTAEEKKVFSKSNRENKFDINELGNLKIFFNSFKNDSSTLLSDDDNNLGQFDDCHIFNIKINSKDLPIDEMKFCCKDKRICYNSCGKDKKKECDLNFQSCLKGLCKQRFDYTNKTLVQRYKMAMKIKRQMESSMLNNNNNNKQDGINSKDFEALELIDLDEDSIHYSERIIINDEVDYDEKEEEEEDENKSNKESIANGLKRTIKNRLKDKYKSCKLASKVLIIGNLAFGCQAYKAAQWSSCCKHN